MTYHHLPVPRAVALSLPGLAAAALAIASSACATVPDPNGDAPALKWTIFHGGGWESRTGGDTIDVSGSDTLLVVILSGETKGGMKSAHLEARRVQPCGGESTYQPVDGQAKVTEEGVATVAIANFTDDLAWVMTNCVLPGVPTLTLTGRVTAASENFTQRELTINVIP